MTDTTSTPTNELSDDELRKLFLWCREHTAEPDALTTLNDMGPILLRPSVGKDMIETVNAIIDTLANEKEPSAHIHAHMMILLSTLIDHRSQRDAFDAILLRWMRHPASFGPARATPPELQREAFVQRLADALGWNAISVATDRDAIARFLAWVDTWAPKQKSAAGRIIALMRRNFPEGGELWRLVRYEQQTHHYGNKNNNNRNNNQQNQGRNRNNQNGGHNKSKQPNNGPNNGANQAAPAGDATATGEVSADGTTATAATGAPGTPGTASAPGAPGEGKRRRNRRRNRNRNGGAPTTGADGTVSAQGAGDAGDDGGDDGADSGESAAPAAPATAAPATPAAGGDSSGNA